MARVLLWRAPSTPLIEAIQPIADALGATVHDAERVTGADLPLFWEGELVGGLRRPDLHDALDTLLQAVEREMGIPRSEMDRAQKQEAVALLNEWGAFTLRKSVADVAEACLLYTSPSQRD